MKKSEFMDRLAQELQKKNIADAEEILQEYEEHFAMKMADGYIEEEIAARLGNPAALAAQFDEAGDTPKQKTGSRRLVVAGLSIADVLAALAFAAAAVCLLGGVSIQGLLPAMPYWCGAILALSLAALAVLFAVGCVYYASFLRQMMRSFGRFQHNALAGASGETGLPPLPISPQFSAKAKRRLRTAALVSLALFAACFVLSYIVCALTAGSLEFWHAWGWFGN